MIEYYITKPFLLLARLLHIHVWQDRGVNRYGYTTYKVCLACGKSVRRTNKPFQPDKWAPCARVADLDSQFDKYNKFIF